jgi:LuxR family maltose regulon positive regulatory protein
VLIAEGSPESLEEAETRLTGFLKANDDQHNLCHAIQISVLLATVFSKQGRNDEALIALRTAVEFGETGAWMEPFIELRSDLMGLLTQLAEQEESLDYVQVILDKLDSLTSPEVPDMAPPSDGVASPSEDEDAVLRLTIREREVLELMASGLSNKEIGDKLHLSTETIKKHLYNVYQKLNAHNRTTALAIARDLGILPSG